MINQEYAQNLNNKLAEKCRKALEKSYGSAIPVPKCIVEHARSEYGLLNRNTLR
jgi:hypothetical protein